MCVCVCVCVCSMFEKGMTVKMYFSRTEYIICVLACTLYMAPEWPLFQKNPRTATAIKPTHVKNAVVFEEPIFD